MGNTQNIELFALILMMKNALYADKIVEVHHFDGNNTNNTPENLMPLCPTHHRYWHSRYKELVYDKVVKYIEKNLLKRGYHEFRTICKKRSSFR